MTFYHTVACSGIQGGNLQKTLCIIVHYNMVGVTVAMVISTMHEKSCIDSHNARKFEKKFQNSVIHTSRNHNDEIAEVSPSLIF